MWLKAEFKWSLSSTYWIVWLKWRFHQKSDEYLPTCQAQKTYLTCTSYPHYSYILELFFCYQAMENLKSVIFLLLGLFLSASVEGKRLPADGQELVPQSRWGSSGWGSSGISGGFVAAFPFSCGCLTSCVSSIHPRLDWPNLTFSRNKYHQLHWLKRSETFWIFQNMSYVGLFCSNELNFKTIFLGGQLL